MYLYVKIASNFIDSLHQFEYMSKMAAEKEEEEDAETRKAMKELDMLYDRFQVLFAELEKCTRDYELKKKFVRSMINRSLRKLIQRCIISMVL